MDYKSRLEGTYRGNILGFRGTIKGYTTNLVQGSHGAAHRRPPRFGCARPFVEQFRQGIFLELSCCNRSGLKGPLSRTYLTNENDILVS